MPLAVRLAGRELRRGKGGFAVFLVCLALGVALVAGVGSLSSAVRAGVERDARTILGGDVEVRLSYRSAPQEARELLDARGGVSQSARMRVLVSAGGERPVLAELKGVDENYPLYGDLELAPPLPHQAVFGERNGVFGAACDPLLLERLGAQVGDTVFVSGKTFEIRAVIRREPDRRISLFSLGPRLMVSMHALDAAGLMRPGSLVRHSLRVRLEDGTAPGEAAAMLEEAFPQAGWRIRTADDVSPRINRHLENLRLYLTFAGLSAVLVAGLGMGGAVRGYLRAKTRSIAVLKCLGASPSLVLAVYLLQVLLLCLLGILAGLAVGGGLPLFLAPRLAESFGVPAAAGIYAAPLAEAGGFGLLAGLAFGLGPLMAARLTPGASLFTSGDLPGRRGDRLTVLAVAGAALALAAYTVLVSHDKAMAAAFAAGAAGALLLFRGVSALVGRAARSFRPRGHPVLSLAAAGLSRPGNATTTVLFALGLGLSVLVAVNQVDENFSRRIGEVMPETAPAYYFIDIQPEQTAPFESLLRSIEGVEKVETRPMLRARIVGIDGQDVSEVDIPEDYRWTVRSDRGVSFYDDLRSTETLTAGKWWGADYRGKPVVSLAADIAAAFGVGVGDTLTLNVLGREMEVEIMSLREVDWESLVMNFALVLPPSVLQSAPHTSIATVHTGRDADEADILRRVSRAFPNVTGIYVKDVLDRAAELLSGLAGAVRAVALAAVAAGVLVLAGTLRAAVSARIYEAVILKVVGAGRWQVLAMLGAELALLGLVAGLVSVALGGLTAWLLVDAVFDFQWRFEPLSAALVVSGAVAATLALGLSGVGSVLGKKPMSVLRNQ